MPRTYKSQKANLWTEKTLQDALAEKQALGTSDRQLAKKYRIPRTSLARHFAGNVGKR